MINTAKGAKLYASQNDVFYYNDPSLTSIVGKEGVQVDSIVRSNDSYVGTSTGETEGDFVKVDWVNSYIEHYFFTNTPHDDPRQSWVQISQLKNTTTEQDDANLLAKTAADLKTVTGAGGGSKTGSNTTMYLILGAMGAITTGIVAYKLTSKPKIAPVPAAVPTTTTKAKPSKK
jgi:hypothetical protein